MSWARSLAAAALTVATGVSKSADESSTGALLKFPYAHENHPLYGVEWEVAPSQFGIHNYGGALLGFLVLPMNTSYHTGCDLEPTGKNDYIRWVQEWNEDTEAIWIMVLDRGDCDFTLKVENAQARGAAGVIVLDYIPEDEFTMWPPENWEDDIDIPSVLLDYADSKVLMKAFGVRNWNPSDIPQTTYPSVSAWNKTLALIEWGLPHNDDRVEYELWTSANDVHSVKFKKHWKNTALAFEYGNFTKFTPHLYLLNGTNWGCDDGQFRCGTQCTNSGLYCAVDPDYDLEIGVDGMDVVQENLRSLCVWDFVKADPIHRNQSIWWDYAILWDHQCANKTETFHKDCSYAQMDVINSGLTDYVTQCITNSGGYAYDGGVNTLMESETRLREEKSIYALPTVRVNEFMVHGNIDCDEITEEKCQVLDAICAGFLEGTEPPQCHRTPIPTPEVCPEPDKDCKGVCYGRFQWDACGMCYLTSDPRFDACLGCDGVPDSGKTFDCTGDCGGDKRVNHCGMCLSQQNMTKWLHEGEDCREVCNGKWEVDRCGKCLSVDDEKWDACEDDSSSGGGGNNSGTNAAIAIGVVALLLLLVAGVALYRLWNRQREVDAQFSSIMRTYKLMDEGPSDGLDDETEAVLPVPNEEPLEEVEIDEEGADEDDAVL